MGSAYLNPEKELNVCPECKGKTKFSLIGKKNKNRKAPIFLGRFKCLKCDWQSDPLALDHYPTRPKNPVYLSYHYSKQDKRLHIWVYTTEKVVDSSTTEYMDDTDRHLLTVTATPTSLRICPNVPFSLPNKRLKEGLMFLQDNKDLIASPCAECSQDQRNDCLDSKEPCKKKAKT
jgi:hypothetical protein